ncbi:hypothetical protein CYMTET_3317 [Cymbomonas tetramitiformis]|uniref:Uncharacterized protein n=1 Tax=Cymbomonas tetramitiformis TaxID=36881 RepID=A0AAE0H3I9_9CHLO|nr:hypothetical protein CYMTET_3317 [Cymbomonas tetramitiformis]
MTLWQEHSLEKLAWRRWCTKGRRAQTMRTLVNAVVDWAAWTASRAELQAWSSRMLRCVPVARQRRRIRAWAEVLSLQYAQRRMLQRWQRRRESAAARAVCSAWHIWVGRKAALRLLQARAVRALRSLRLSMLLRAWISRVKDGACRRQLLAGVVRRMRLGSLRRRIQAWSRESARLRARARQVLNAKGRHTRCRARRTLESWREAAGQELVARQAVARVVWVAGVRKLAATIRAWAARAADGNSRRTVLAGVTRRVQLGRQWRCLHEWAFQRRRSRARWQAALTKRCAAVIGEAYARWTAVAQRARAGSRLEGRGMRVLGGRRLAAVVKTWAGHVTAGHEKDLELRGAIQCMRRKLGQRCLRAWAEMGGTLRAQRRALRQLAEWRSRSVAGEVVAAWWTVRARAQAAARLQSRWHCRVVLQSVQCWQKWAQGRVAARQVAAKAHKVLERRVRAISLRFWRSCGVARAAWRVTGRRAVRRVQAGLQGRCLHSWVDHHQQKRIAGRRLAGARRRLEAAAVRAACGVWLDAVGRARQKHATWRIVDRVGRARRTRVLKRIVGVWMKRAWQAKTLMSAAGRVQRKAQARCLQQWAELARGCHAHRGSRQEGALRRCLAQWQSTQRVVYVIRRQRAGHARAALRRMVVRWACHAQFKGHAGYAAQRHAVVTGRRRAEAAWEAWLARMRVIHTIMRCAARRTARVAVRLLARWRAVTVHKLLLSTTWSGYRRLLSRRRKRAALALWMQAGADCQRGRALLSLRRSELQLAGEPGRLRMRWLVVRPLTEWRLWAVRNGEVRGSGEGALRQRLLRGKLRAAWHAWLSVWRWQRWVAQVVARLTRRRPRAVFAAWQQLLWRRRVGRARALHLASHLTRAHRTMVAIFSSWRLLRLGRRPPANRTASASGKEMGDAGLSGGRTKLTSNAADTPQVDVGASAHTPSMPGAAWTAAATAQFSQHAPDLQEASVEKAGPRAAESPNAGGGALLAEGRLQAQVASLREQKALLEGSLMEEGFNVHRLQKELDRLKGTIMCITEPKPSAASHRTPTSGAMRHALPLSSTPRNHVPKTLSRSATHLPSGPASARTEPGPRSSNEAPTWMPSTIDMFLELSTKDD